MALTDLTRISTSGIATGTSLSGAILHGDAHFRGTNAGITSALFDSSDNALEFNDDVKLKLGNSGDFEIYHRGADGVSIINETGSAYLSIGSNGNKVELYDTANGRAMAEFATGGACSFKHGATTRFQTTQTGAIVTGILTATGFSGPLSNASGISTFYDLKVTNNLTVEGTTSTLDTTLIGVDRVEVGANSNSIVGVAVTQSGTADLVNLFDGATKVVTVDDIGRVGLGTDIPSAPLHIHKTSGTSLLKLENTNGTSQLDIRHTNGYGAVHYIYQGSEKWRAGQTGQFTDYSIYQSTGVGSGQTPYRFVVKNSGNVGVSTFEPREILHVNKPTGTACVLVSSPTAPQIRFNPNVTDTTDGDRTIFGQATGNSQFVNSAVSGDTILRGTSSGTLRFGIGNNEKVRITSSGNLEIINNNDYLKIGAGGALSMVFTGGQSYITNSTGHLTGRSASYTWENVDGTAEYFRISSAGKIGINEVNPQQQLHIHEDTIYNGILINGSNAPRIGFARQTTATGEWSVGIDGTNGNQFAITNSNNNSNRKFIISSSQISLLDTTQVEGDFKVTNAGNGGVEIETQTSRTVFRGGGGIAITGASGQNNNGLVNIYPTGSAVYSYLNFYNAAGNSVASIVAHEGQSLFFDSGTNGPLRHRVNGTGFHSFQEGNTERVRITAGGNVNIGTSDLSQTDRLLNVYGGRMRVTYAGPGNSIELMNNASSGNSYGLLCSSGTTSGDYNAEFRQQNGTSILRIRGDGNIGIKNGSPFNRFCVGGHTFTGDDAMYSDARVGMSNHGNLTGLMLASTYNDSTYPEYGLVFVQGPDTSSYNAWSVSPDGPAKGDSLNFHYSQYSGSGGRPNIHNPSFKKFEMNGDGNFHITDGNLKLASGHGIDFHNYGTGTNIDSNLLDDYEEGSWTPNPHFATTGDAGETALADGGLQGQYVKIGRLVYYTFSINFQSRNSNASGNFYISGLPFNVSNTYWNEESGFPSAYYSGLTNATAPPSTQPSHADKLYFAHPSGQGNHSGNTYLNHNNIGTGHIRIRGGGVYRTAT